MKRSTLPSLNSFIICGLGTKKAIKIAFLAMLFCLAGFTGYSAVTVTSATGGTNICSNTATAPTTLGPITITEGLMTDFPNGSSSIVLAPPPGWTFVVSLPTVSAAPGGDVSIGVISVSSGAVSINFNASGITHIDVITIANLQIQATSALSLAGYIFAQSDFGVVGITVGATGTNFGNLSIAAASVPAVTIAGLPSGPICAGTGVTFTPTPTNGGASPTYQWLVNGSFVGASVFYATSTLANGNTVSCVMTPTAGGCVFPATATSNTITMTVNPVPNTVTVSGGGTFCGSATITAALVGLGTVYFQGTTSGGTSVATPSLSQIVSSSGTYYFRALSAGGCWGNEGSVTVTINPAATANAGVAQGTCLGSSVTLAGSIGGGATSATWSAPSGTFSNPSSLTSTFTPTVAGPVTLTLTTNDPDGAGPCAAATSTVVITANAIPTVVTASGGGTFCGSALITGINGGSGTIFFQGTTSGGTSTVLGNSPQTVNASGTYYFRAQSGAGCWGPEGSVTVTINPPATANAGTPQSVCAGGTITLAGSIGGSATTSNWTAPSGVFGTPSSVTSTYTPSIASGGVTLTLTTNDPDGAGPCAAAVSTVVITVNALPNTPTTLGGGTFCNTTNITSSLVGPGTLFFQGTTSGGTSTVLGGSPQTINASGTYYFRAQSAAGCWGTESSVIVTINPLPTQFNVTGGGGYCTGGTGVDVGLSFSTPGVNYQLFRGVTALAILPGTGAAIDFGLQTVAGTYTVTATNPTTGCTRAMLGNAVVSINALPTAFFVTGGGAYCAGGAGALVNLSGSAVGVNYQLMVAGLPSGAPVAGTGAGFTFGPQTTGGVYTAVATNTLTGCTNTMSGSATVVVNPLPTAFSVTGGGGYCAGGTGLLIGLGNSTVGVSYQLFNGVTSVGAALAGTGAALNFGLQTAAGTYTVVATNTTTFCVNTMTGTAVITINPLPTAFTVTGGGSYCAGGTGVAVGLTGSTAGVNYQLMLGASPSGLAVAGTGFALDFGLQTSAGTYTVVATDATTLCTGVMTGSAIISINAVPTAFIVSGGGSYCTGGSGVGIGLLGSQVGVSYQLYNLFAPVGAPVAGTGGIISFGLQTAAGFYTVVATNNITLCTNNMTSGVAVTILPLPTAYNVTGGGSYCVGGTGVHVNLDGSDAGTNYQLFNGVTPVGVPVAGTGLALDFGLQTVAGTYTVVATSVSTGCVNNMAGSSTVSIVGLPGAFAVTGGGFYCAGGTGVHIGLSGSASGVNYQLFNGASAVGAPLPGTGLALDFGLITATGTYTIVATDATSSCTSNMTGSATVSTNPAPLSYTVVGGGAYCMGGTGVHVGLSFSDAGVDYQLMMGGSPVGAAVSGSGAALDFGLQTSPGTYTVDATILATGCTATMTGSAVVTVNPAPTSYLIMGGGVICAGGTGLDVSLAGSDAGVNYQLFVGVTAVGAPLAGTGLAIDFGLQTAGGVYTVVATNVATGCTNTMGSTATVTVLPAPTPFTISSGGTYCVGGVGFDITLSGSVAGTNYQLFNGATVVGAVMPGTGSSLDFGFQTAAGTYTVVATNIGTGCSATMTGTAVINISTFPVVNAISGPSTVCRFGTATLTDATAGGVWTSATIAIATVGSASGTVTGVTTGTATISYTVTNPGGCATSVTATINVLASPIVSAISGATSVCQGLTITLTDATSGGTWSSSNPAIASVSGSGTVTGVAVGSATITYTVTSGVTGCTTKVTSPVTVGNPMPTAALIPAGSATLCHGNPVNLTLVTAGGSGLTYTWYVGGVVIAGVTSTTYTATLPGLYTVKIDNGTCTETFAGTNVVNPPVPVISLDTLPNLLFTGAFVTYQWFLGGVAIPGATNNNILQGPLGSVYTVVVTDINGCSDTSAAWIVGGAVLGVQPPAVKADIKIYPNPVSSILYIEAPVKVMVSVVSTDGRTLIDRKEAVSLNVGQLADGMYMIMVYDENNNLLKTDKFMKVQ